MERTGSGATWRSVLKFGYGVIAALCCLSATANGDGLTIEDFTPQGVARDVRQVQVRFSEAVVPLSAGMSPLRPFHSTCDDIGKPRWLDERTWLFEFANALPSGRSCEFTAAADLVALSGAKLTGAATFVFSTGGPVIASINPFNGAAIEEEPYFRIELSGPVDVDSVEEHVSLVDAQLASPIGVTVVTGRIADDLWELAKDENVPVERRLVIKPRLRLAPDAAVKLVWGAGVRAPSGEVLDTEQVYEYAVRGPFEATLRCERTNPSARCIPLQPLTLDFSAPVPVNRAYEVFLRAPHGQVWRPEGENDTKVNLIEQLVFRGPFPESTDLEIVLPQDFRDDIGRPLDRREPLVAPIDAYPPLVKFGASFGIIERGAPALLPVTVRRVESPLTGHISSIRKGALGGFPAQVKRLTALDEIVTTLGRLNQLGAEISMFETAKSGETTALTIPRPSGERSFEVIGIPFEKPGFYAVEVASKKLGAAYLDSEKSFYVRTGVLVTDLGVHLKVGAERSLVWVTRLSSGDVVPNAAVVVADCRGKIVAQGQTDARGAFIATGIPRSLAYDYCAGKPTQLIATAMKGDDFSFVLSSWNDGIEPWRFAVSFGYPGESPLMAHTVLAQSLVRRGDTVKMKHIVRRRTGRGFEAMTGTKPTKVRLTHLGTYDSFDLPLGGWRSGAAESEWRVPQGAKLGTYSIGLVSVRPDKSEDVLESGSVRVESFRVPLMRGLLSAPSEPLIAPTSVPVTAVVSYLSGGNARGLPVTVRYRAYPVSDISFERLEGYDFANGKAPEGEVDSTDQNDMSVPENVRLRSTTAVLDEAGSASIRLGDLPRQEAALRLDAELEYRDVAGFVQTVRTQVPLWSADVLLGIKTKSWIATGPTNVEIVAVSPTGERRAGVPVSLDVLTRKAFSHRKRVVGGFYSYDSRFVTERGDTVCSGVTDEAGVLVCTVTPASTGDFYFEARTTDSAGRSSRAHRMVWVAADAPAWFGGRDDDRVDVLPEKKRYEAGETARLQVRVPFERATALVTVEREGVLDSFVQVLDSHDPFVDVALKPEYAPNVYVSVLAVRGRVGSVMPTATIDLGRPAYKLGIAPLEVGWKPNELAVTVEPERSVYRVREKVKVKIRAAQAIDGAPAARGEVALAAIDEGLLELAPNDSWALLDRMMGRRSLSVATATAQMHVVGRRHFGLKARPDGGGGGTSPTRELFDALLYWNPRVALDERGEGTVEVPLNDSITSFRIVAIATSGLARFGTGHASVRATQDLIVVPAFPPVARHGDTVMSPVAVRNTTAESIDIELILESSDVRMTVPPVTRTVPAGGATEVVWPLTIPNDLDLIHYSVVARAGGTEVDRVALTQTVTAPTPVGVFAATLRQLGGAGLTIPVETPPGAVAGKGGVTVSVAARLGDGMNGVREEMRLYPFTCIEQQISKAIALGDEAGWKRISDILPTYLDESGRLKYFVSENQGSYELTAYVLAISGARGWTLPSSVRTRMVTYLRSVAQGSSDSVGSSSARLMERIAAFDALTWAGEDVSDLVSGLVIDPTVLSTSNLISWFGVLARTPEVRGRGAALELMRNNLRARLVMSGKELTFSTESADREWWRMSSPDVNAVRLLMTLVTLDEWRDEVPRIAQGALARQQAGAWDLTVANAWGILAFERFSERFEKTPVRGETTVGFAGAMKKVDWSGKKSPVPVDFGWPVEVTDLSVIQKGSGEPWVSVQTRAAIPLTEPISRGYRVTKSLEPVVQRAPGRWSVGDIVRVKLDFDAAVDRTWVVFDDPIPPGATVIGGDALGQSIAANPMSGGGLDRVYPTFEERTFETYRAYLDFLPQGRGRVEYTLRLNTAGDFALPDTRVEAMYSPDVFGQIPQSRLRIEP